MVSVVRSDEVRFAGSDARQLQRRGFEVTIYTQTANARLQAGPILHLKETGDPKRLQDTARCDERGSLKLVTSIELIRLQLRFHMKTIE
jgi:hypothetical protein